MWFNAHEVDPASSGGALPVGKHPVVIKASKTQAVASGAGGMLVFTLEAIDGPAKGQTMDYRLNMWNEGPNKDTVTRIAASQLSAICHVTQTYQLVGKPEGVELFGKPFIVNVRTQIDRETKQPNANGYTEIFEVLDIGGNPATKVGAGATPAQTAANSPPQQFPATTAPVAEAKPAWSGATASSPTGAAQQPAQQPWQQQAPAGDKPAWAR